EAREVVAQAAAARDAEAAPFRIDLPRTAGLLKSNAFPVSCPTEVLQFAAPAFTGEGAWGRLRTHTKGTNVVAAPHGKKVLAVGLVDDVRRLFDLPEEEMIERV